MTRFYHTKTGAEVRREQQEVEGIHGRRASRDEGAVFKSRRRPRAAKPADKADEEGHYRGWIETYWTPMQEILRDGRRVGN